MNPLSESSYPLHGAQAYRRRAGVDGRPPISRLRSVLHLRQRSVSAFHVCGLIGFALALLIEFSMASYRQLPMDVTALLAVSSLLTFFALAILTKAFLGFERLVYYRHEIAILLVAAFVVGVFNQPVLAFLDIVLLSVGGFLMCGRVGCFLVGCCHGCPHKLGVRYRAEHAVGGFPESLVGIRLLPVQLVESAAVAFTVAGGLVLVLRDAPAGAVLAWYSIVYGLVRFTLEFFRGDASRPYAGSFSEAQWTTLLLMVLAVVGELAGLLPLSPWHIAVVAGLCVFMVAYWATDDASRRIFRAAHVQEVAAILKAAAIRGRDNAGIYMDTTELGMHLSASSARQGSAVMTFIAFSLPSRTIDRGSVTRFARVLMCLAGKEGELVEGLHGVHHVIFRSAGGEHAV